MPLEAVMICIDNSDYTRNGDYTPTRFESQTAAADLLCGAKTQQNPENSVGILATAGDRIEVMITPTTDLGKIVSEIPKICITGSADVLRGIQTAQLALKHRQNKNQKQRIIAFVGSPVMSSEKELETLGKNLKKNNVSLDLISFGEIEENTGKLEKLLGAVNSNETSHLLEVPVGPKLLSDVLLSSVIINAEGEGVGAGGGAGGGAGEGFEFGINPNDDPELALALRISMEEERARQQQAAPGGSGEAATSTGGAAAAAIPGGAGAVGTSSSPEAASGGTAAAAAGAAAAAATGAPQAADLPMATDASIMEAMGLGSLDDMDEELKQALLLSMQEAEPSAAAGGAGEATVAAAAPEAKQEVATAPATSTEAVDPAEGVDPKWFQDKDFVRELLGNLPGVDMEDPKIQNVLANQSSDKDGDASNNNAGAGSSNSGGSTEKK